MAKINILDSTVYNRIAAGEVVERPASAVKELVENSIDAGAKSVEVHIERGGKDLIRVCDDGEGIERDELASAFLPHATSKIGRAEDLEAIATLGFRGEALASIAAVANVCIRSKFRGAKEAWSLACSGGQMGEIAPCALGEGTEIAVENLFFNTPARLKFLKSDKGEESEVTGLMARFVLGNPHIAFRYSADGRTALQSFGGGPDEAVAAVYGAGVLSRCYKIEAQKHGIRLHGYIGKPDFSKPNRTYQSVFVNGRAVVNQTISSAISNAYASYLMKRQYPFYVLFVDLPREAVDVNVHPNKADVRFEDNRVVYGAIYSVVSAVLDGNASALEFMADASAGTAETSAETLAADAFAGTPGDVPAPQAARPLAERGAESVKNAGDAVYVGNGADAEKEAETPPKNRNIGNLQSTTPGINSGFYGDRTPWSARLEFFDSAAAPAMGAREEGNGAKENGAESASANDVFAENKRYLEMLDRKAAQQKIVLESAQYRGTLFNTYLLYEAGDAVYLIDQHAAHERLIFDKLRAEMENRAVMQQPMLVPYVLHVNSAEREFVAENLETLRAIGFDVEPFGPDDFKVSAVPLDLQDIDLAAFFAEVLREVGALHAVRLSELLRDRIAMTACKHAVKGGMALTAEEKEKLFAMLDGDMGLKCPHGRPVAVRMSRQEIEKMFKRIV